MKGPTTLWGHLIRVGGREPKATIRQRDGNLFGIDITESLARELGRFLYRDIGIEGIASWRIGDMMLVAFKASRVTEYRPDDTTLTQSFRKLGEASGGRWEGIDADAYVRNLRYGDES